MDIKEAQDAIKKTINRISFSYKGKPIHPEDVKMVIDDKEETLLGALQLFLWANYQVNRLQEAIDEIFGE